MPKMKKCIIVVGPPRSGTSAVANVVSKLGVNFGDPKKFIDPRNNKHNPIFFELESLNRINDDIFTHYSKNWADFDWLPDRSDFSEEVCSKFELNIADFIEEEFDNAELIGLKDPRFSYTLPLWEKVLTRIGFNLIYIFVRRSSSSVFISNKIVNRSSSATNFQAVAQSNLLTARFVQSRPFITIFYEELLRNPNTSIKSICKTAQLPLDRLKEASSILDKNLQHHDKDSLTPLYKYLSDAIDSDEIDPEEYDKYREIFSASTYEKNKKIENLFAQVNEKDQALQEKTVLVAEKEQALQVLTAQVSEKDQAVQALTAQVSEKDQAVQALTAQVSEKDQAVQALSDQMGEKEQQLESWELQLKERIIINQNLSDELHLIYISKKWRLAMFFLKIRMWLIPIGSRRENIVRLILKGLRVLKNEGILVFIGKFLRRIRRKKNKVIIEVPEVILNSYEQWIKLNEPELKELNKQRKISGEFKNQPLISIIVPVFETPPTVLIEMIESVKAQTYEKWELCIGNSSPDKLEITEILQYFNSEDERIVIRDLEGNKGISENSNFILSFATGQYVALLDHDDTIAPFALFEVVKLLNTNSAYDFIYSDKDMIDAEGKKRFAPLFKPDWSPDMMLSVNYLTHLCVIRKQLLEEIGGFNSSMDGAQDWDIFLKLTDKTNKIAHIPKVLYHWRQIPTSVASGIHAKPYALQSQRRATIEHMKRNGLIANAAHLHDGMIRVMWPITGKNRVSIIFLLEENDNNTFKKIIKNINRKTYYHDFEFIFVTSGINKDNAPELNIENACVVVVSSTEFSNRTKACNAGYHKSSGDILLFLNHDLIPLEFDWMEELVKWTEQDEIGAVGGMLLNPDNSIAFTGSIIEQKTMSSLFFGVNLDNIHFSPFGQANWLRNFSVLSIDCFMISRKDFEKVGAFNEKLDEIEAVAEFCFHLRTLGRRLTYTPFARLKYLNFHNVIKTKPILNKAPFFNKETNIIDPYFNSNLILNQGLPEFFKNKDHFFSTNQPIEDFPVIKLGMWEQYCSDASALSSLFNFNSKDLEHNTEVMINNQGFLNIKTVTWFLPDFNYAFYGGLHTIFRFANYLKEKQDVENTFVILGDGDVAKIKTSLGKIFPLLEDQKVQYIQSYQQINKLPDSDACIATLWTTAYYALKYNKSRRKFYFIQDFEPGFYPAGSTYAQTEATYRFDFYGITNTISLKKTYEDEYGGHAEYFVPAVDKNVFYARPKNNLLNLPYKVFFYGRPGHPRNAFELGTQALRLLKQSYGDKIEIVTAGSEWNPRQFGLDGVVKNLGLLSYKQTGDLYRECNLGLVMMFTRHPSYLPFELMASGCLVVTNYNRYTSWLLKNKENCLLSNASSDSLVDVMKEGLENDKLRNTITANAKNMIKEHHSDWDTQFNKIYNFMKEEKDKYAVTN